MKKVYTGKSLDELKALAISEIKELGVNEADIKITIVEEPVKKLMVQWPPVFFHWIR